MVDAKRKLYENKDTSFMSILASYLYPVSNRFNVLFVHASTTYENSKLILRMISASKTVQPQTKRYLTRLFILRIVLLLLTVGLNIGISYPMNWYSTALNERKQEDFWYFLKVFVIVVCITAPIFALDSYIHNLLSMRFRQTLTNMLFDLYMTKRAYYHLRWKTNIDNPGQRFGDDIKTFAYGVFDLLNVLLKHILNLLGFSYVLYTIDISSVPMLMVYSFCGTIFALTVFSQKLTQLGYIIMKDQADFIANIIRINDSSECIALYNAAKHERNWLQMRLETLISDGIMNSKWMAGLDLFSQIFHFLSIVVPYVLLAQKYFKKEIEFGELSQSVYAFSALLKALNIIINNISTLTSLSSTATRVGDAIHAVRAIHNEHKLNNVQLVTNTNDVLSSKIVTQETTQTMLKLENISYSAPGSDYLLLDRLRLNMNNNESLLIVGFSGCGKSSLLRVIAGLWNDGRGTVIRPELKYCLFLPQKPYIPNLPLEFNTLRNQLLFPKYVNPDSMTNNITATCTHFEEMEDDDNTYLLQLDDTYILDVLTKINLTHLDTYSTVARTGNAQSLLYCKADWGNCLSVGEQQRLAIGRCLISSPNMIFVDEATSALDSMNEAEMYKQLKDLNVPLVSVGHHRDLAKYHDYVLQFERDGKWKVIPSREFLSM